MREQKLFGMCRRRRGLRKAECEWWLAQSKVACNGREHIASTDGVRGEQSQATVVIAVQRSLIAVQHRLLLGATAAMRFDLVGDHVCKAELAELSQKLRNIASDIQSLSQSEPDFLIRLQALQRQLDLVASRFRRVNHGEDNHCPRRPIEGVAQRPPRSYS